MRRACSPAPSPSSSRDVRTAAILGAIAAGALPAGARAEPVSEPGPGLGLGDRNRAGVLISAVLPTGAWRERAGPGGGAAVWLEVPISPRLVVTARAGGLIHAPATLSIGARVFLIEVPVLGGARLELARAGRLRFLAGGDVGLVVAHERVTFGGVTEGDTNLRFGSALVVGVAIDRVVVEGGPWLADLADLDHAVGFQVTAAVRLRSW